MSLISAEFVASTEVLGGKVIEAELTNKSKAVMMRFGAFVRRRAQTSIRYRNRKSKAGEPPSGHRSNRFTRLKANRKTGATHRQASSPLRELIAFAVVDEGRAVIIGPMIFRNSAIGAGEIPPLLEKGGTGHFKSGDTIKIGHYAPRPYMGPAFKAELPRAPKLFGRFAA